MIIYNETIVMDETIYAEWLNWIKTVHIPAVMATGYFDSYKLLNILDSPNEGVTCCVQYNVADVKRYRQFASQHQGYLQSVHHQKFENKFVMFNTLMQTID
jgi:hypothetical protein